MIRRLGAYQATVVLVLLLACGCQSPIASSGQNALAPTSHAHLLHLPGIAGDSPFDRWWMNALKDAGAARDVELYDWTGSRKWIDALQAYRQNRAEAARIAQHIEQSLHRDPQSSVILTSCSGGAGPAIWALEQLPAGVQVESVVLVAPALSPGYDLTAALRHVKGKLYAFTSPGDVFMLGAGTNLFGTIDGVKTDAAGLVGFRPPKDADAGQYRKLVTFRYDLSWLRYLNFGDHSGGMSVLFAREFIAPLLREPAVEESHMTRHG